MMKTDSADAAKKALEKFPDRRVKQFFDARQLAGRAIAKSLGHRDEIAWDIYLFYPSGAIWHELPPPPETYMHQLSGGWADQSRLFEGGRLEAKLADTMKLLFP
jgi:hypothetical protein